MRYGMLPKSLNIKGTYYNIRTDFRVVLRIFEAFNDNDMDDYEKWRVAIDILFYDYNNIEYCEETFEQIIWFINCGQEESKSKAVEVFSWEQDEQLIFSAINNSAHQELRMVEYCHWWTFIGHFNNIGDGLLSSIIHIRHKLNSKTKLEKHEQLFYKQNKELIDIKKKYDDNAINFMNMLKEKNMKGGV